MARKVACIDYDGTIVPWGELDGEGPPFDYAAVVIKALKADGFTIVILTSRMSPRWLTHHFGECVESMAAQRAHVARVLDRYGIPYDDITAEKVPAQFYLDDRAIRFNGDWLESSREILALEP